MKSEMADTASLNASPGAPVTRRAAAPPTGPMPAGGREKNGPAVGERLRAKKSRKKLILLAVALVLVAFVAKQEFLKPHYGPGEKVPAGQIVDLGAGTITTNLSDGHLAQIAVSLQLTKPANTREVDAETSELTGSTVQILGEQTYSGLLDPTGREALEHALLRAYQLDLGLSEGAQQVTAVYFTSFVLQ